MTAAHLKQSPSGGAAPRPEFLPGCSGKEKHSRQAARTIMLRRGAGQIYECPHCYAWHTSGVPANVPRRKDPVP